MKAIVKVKKGSGYSDYNGLTFEVKKVLSNLICLKIPSKLDIPNIFDNIDFSFDEVFIVDIEKEIDLYQNTNTVENLKEYCKKNKINLQ